MKSDEMSPEIFGIYTPANGGKSEVVIIKSKWMEHAINEDGMTEEEALEFWDFNVEGSKGEGQYSVVDDTLDVGSIRELVDYGSAFDPRA